MRSPKHQGLHFPFLRGVTSNFFVEGSRVSRYWTLTFKKQMPSLKLTSVIPNGNEKVFQPSMFRCENVSFREGNCFPILLINLFLLAYILQFLRSQTFNSCGQFFPANWHPNLEEACDLLIPHSCRSGKSLRSVTVSTPSQQKGHQQGSLYYQPKQCTINGKSIKFTRYFHCLMPPKWVI